MHFGEPNERHHTPGAAPGAVNSGLKLVLFCDGGSTPNPGEVRPVVYTEAGFLPIPPTESGTNHGAVYDAVDLALQHALTVGATDVTIELASRLVWGQVTDNMGCIKLEDRREHAQTLSSRIPSVTWVQVGPPFRIAGKRLKTARAVRKLAYQQFDPK